MSKVFARVITLKKGDGSNWSGRVQPNHSIFRVEFIMPNGDLLKREWTLSEKWASERRGQLGWMGEEPPHWLQEPSRTEDLNEPITFTGRVKPGFADEARRFIA